MDSFGTVQFASSNIFALFSDIGNGESIEVCMVDVPAIQALRANLLVSWLTLDFHNLWLTIQKHKYPLVISYIAIENDHRIYVDFPRMQFIA